MSKRTSRKLPERLSGLFESLPEADPAPDGDGRGATASAVPGGWLWESDLQGRYTWCSPEIERFLGRRAVDLVGLEVASTALSDESSAMVRPMIDSGRPVEGLRLEATAVDGRELQLLFSASLRPGLNGKPNGFRGAVQVLAVLPAPAATAAAPPAAPVEQASPPAAEVERLPAVFEPAPALDDEVDEAAWTSPDLDLAPAVAEPLPTELEAAAPSPQEPEAPAEEHPEAPPAQTPAAPPPRRAPTTPLRGTGRLRQTGGLRQTGPLASQLAVAAAVAADEVTPTEPPPLLAAWGPTSAYLDSAEGLQPVTPEPGIRVSQPRIEGNRLLVPIQVKDEVLGVLSFDENDRGGEWTEDDIAMALAISEQLAVALQDARSVQLTEQALEEMREADRLKTQFLANMSHELRTPLNSIIGFSRVILKGIDGPINETQEQDLKAIHGAGLHLLGLINDILDLSKIEAGKMELTFGEMDLAETVRGVMSTAAGLVKDKTIELVAQVPDDLPLIQADSIRVRQILLNLVSNAAKFTDQGQIELSVSLIEDGAPPEVLISVADTGPGIAPEDQVKLFEPFSQVDASPTRKTGGTGLGLSICRHLVELHGGTIWIESRPGQGSVFFFTLPTYPADLPPDEMQTELRPLVLAVEERPAAIEQYRQAFDALGYDLHATSRLDEIRTLVARRAPVLVVVDPLLSQQRAWSIVAALRLLDPVRRAPILLGGLDPEKGIGYRLHARDLRLRPTERHELLGAVRRLAPQEGKPIRLLAIEDEEGQAAELQQAVQSDPLVSLRLTANSTEAYHATRSEVPDVILLSLMMARAEGFRTLEILRKDARLRATPVLALLSPEPHPEERRQMALYAEYLSRQKALTPEAYLEELREITQGETARR